MKERKGKERKGKERKGSQRLVVGTIDVPG